MVERQGGKERGKPASPERQRGGVGVWSLFAPWVPYVMEPRKSIAVAMDWTDFDSDAQATIMLRIARDG